MQNLVWINGQIVPESRAGIPVDDSGYLFGYGVFETLVARGETPLFLREHYERMRQNARTLGLSFPLSWNTLKRETRRILKRGGFQKAYLRFNLTEDSRKKTRFIMIARPYKPYPAACYKRGGKLIVVRSAVNDPLPFAGIKTTNYLVKILGRKEAARRQAVEGVLLNAEGHVTEGASSNLFIVKKGNLFTPPLSEGVMPGTRRAVVIKLARRLKIPCLEKPLRLIDLKTADEVFITSTLKDILPIQTFEGKRIGTKCPGPLTHWLSAAFDALVDQLRILM